MSSRSRWIVGLLLSILEKEFQGFKNTRWWPRALPKPAKLLARRANFKIKSSLINHAKSARQSYIIRTNELSFGRPAVRLSAWQILAGIATSFSIGD